MSEDSANSIGLENITVDDSQDLVLEGEDAKEVNGKEEDSLGQGSNSSNQIIEVESRIITKGDKKTGEKVTKVYEEDKDQSPSEKKFNVLLRELAKATKGLIPTGHAGLTLVSETIEPFDPQEVKDLEDDDLQEGLGEEDKENENEQEEENKTDLEKAKEVLKELINPEELEVLNEAASNAVGRDLDLDNLQEEDVKDLVNNSALDNKEDEFDLPKPENSNGNVAAPDLPNSSNSNEISR